MLNEIISIVKQILFFSTIPFLVYVIKHRKVKGFMEDIGLKKSNRKANMYAVIVSILFVAPLLLLGFFNEGFYEIMTSPESVSGRFRAMGFSFEAVVLVLLVAVLQTSFAEEIFFRGFVAKKLIAITSLRTGNILQAVIFGAIHTAIFLTISDDPFILAVIFIFPAIGAYLSVYLNEEMADGSIMPGWISHALANVMSYSIVGFLW